MAGKRDGGCKSLNSVKWCCVLNCENECTELKKNIHRQNYTFAISQFLLVTKGLTIKSLLPSGKLQTIRMKRKIQPILFKFQMGLSVQHEKLIQVHVVLLTNRISVQSSIRALSYLFC